MQLRSKGLQEDYQCRFSQCHLSSLQVGQLYWGGVFLQCQSKARHGTQKKKKKNDTQGREATTSPFCSSPLHTGITEGFWTGGGVWAVSELPPGNKSILSASNENWRRSVWRWKRFGAPSREITASHLSQPPHSHSAFFSAPLCFLAPRPWCPAATLWPSAVRRGSKLWT